MSDKTFSLEWIQNEINYYSEMCVSVSYFDHLDVLKQLRTVTARIAELEGALSKRTSELQYANTSCQEFHSSVSKLESKIARLVEVGDKICEEARLQDPFTDEEGMAILEAWNKEAHE